MRDLLAPGSIPLPAHHPLPGAAGRASSLRGTTTTGLRITSLTPAIAGLSGTFPSSRCPGGTGWRGGPVGLSLVGPPGSELRLAALARALEDTR